MTEKQKSCPQCGSDMDYRLGMFECPQCGHEEEDKVLAAPAAEATGPGFRRESWQRSAPPRPGQVPPPQSVGTIYTPGAAPPAGLYSAEPSSYNPYPSLQVEKVIYLSLTVAGWLLTLIILIAASSALPSIPEVGISMGAVIFGFAIAGLISVGLIWFVLFGDQVWAKYCCGGCMLFSMVTSVPGFFASAPSDFQVPGMGAFKVMYLALVLAFDLWFLSILWRDVQRLQGH